MTMSCVDGPNYQCSGGSVIRTDNGVALTSSGVQVYGNSTSDLATPNPSPTTAIGLTLASGGVAEFRLAKDSNSAVSNPAILLSNLGLSWDGKVERPLIIETFRTTQGRVQLGGITSVALPASSDLGFYNFSTLGTAGTQANYANNVYFPRTIASRCPADLNPCPTTETSGVQIKAGDWRTGGADFDWLAATRFHEDGDVHAGDGVPDATGSGVPFPGSKGYRGVAGWSSQYANLGTWETQDTVLMAEWGAASGAEHNTKRRGVVSFGSVTDPATVPTTGTASYKGIVYGWYASNKTEEPPVFRGDATITVDFATRQVTIAYQNTKTFDAAGNTVPLAFTANAAMGAAGASVANYLTAPTTAGTLAGGISGRYYGPVVSTGTGGTGPAEIGGAFQLSNATTGATAIGGFIALKR
ncbi:hypothetical protein [Noviherbaspirillum sp.]|uniref:hypothetical protein n=1 Tax=Noviherbaspirillum sp. TaxID=1926288 RepID=UPI002B4A9FC5|nr:hypothetical protein [Noviherbaspirillum sp.]HJV82052.1 hypothetical protein [Noviherbaspirillum sp.]